MERVAAFISSVKGPCMAMMREGGRPASSQALRELSMGRTLAKTRSEKPLSDANTESSLLPVVRRMLPSVSSRNDAASFASETKTASPGRAQPSLRTLRYPVPVSSQAFAMFSVTTAA